MRSAQAMRKYSYDWVAKSGVREDGGRYCEGEESKDRNTSFPEKKGGTAAGSRISRVAS